MKKVDIPKTVRIRVSVDNNGLYVCPACELLAERLRDGIEPDIHWFKRHKVISAVDPYISKTLDSRWKTSW
jgi:hypothetical protein